MKEIVREILQDYAVLSVHNQYLRELAEEETIVAQEMARLERHLQEEDGQCER